MTATTATTATTVNESATTTEEPTVTTTATTEPTTTSTIIEAALNGDALPYAEADVKAKAAVRSDLDARMRAAIDSLDMEAAKAAKDALDTIKGARVVTTVTVDYTALLADKISALRLAADRLIDGELADDSQIDYARLNQLLEAAADTDVSWDVHNAATKIIDATKITRSQAAGRSLQDAVDSINASVEPGTFLTVAQIVKAEGLASGGAVASRLFPRSGEPTTLTGVTPVPSTPTTAAGAIFLGN